jgi:cytochrome c-type biogenesis protein CcmE
MLVGSYLDGRPLTYDAENGSFALGDTPVTAEAVRQYRRAGQLEWQSPEIGAWFESSFPEVVTTSLQAQASARKSRLWIVVVVVAVILACVVALFVAPLAGIVVLTGSKQGVVYSTVPKLVSDSSLIGKRVKTAGTVVEGSWDKTSSPMVFVLRDQADKAGTGPTLKVIYTGVAPSTFGDGAVAIVTGVMEADGTLKATEMITK